MQGGKEIHSRTWRSRTRERGCCHADREEEPCERGTEVARLVLDHFHKQEIEMPRHQHDRSDWPESYRADFADENAERLRESWSERQSGPYRSPVSGRTLSEDDYRQESRYYRTQPYTGFSGRSSGFGFESPSWGTRQMGRAGPPSGMHYSTPGEDHRGHGPRDYARSDQRIKEDICDELSDDEQCDARNIDIDVTDAKVTLSGSVPARYMKHRAEDIADETRGVRDVDNRIRVRRRDAESAGGERYTVSEDGGFVKPADSPDSPAADKKTQ